MKLSELGGYLVSWQEVIVQVWDSSGSCVLDEDSWTVHDMEEIGYLELEFAHPCVSEGKAYLFLVCIDKTGRFARDWLPDIES